MSFRLIDLQIKPTDADYLRTLLWLDIENVRFGASDTKEMLERKIDSIRRAKGLIDELDKAQTEVAR